MSHNVIPMQHAPPPPPATLAEAVTTWRRRRRMNQSALAREIGCVPSHISRVESGGSSLSARQLHAVAEALALADEERTLALRLAAEFSLAAAEDAA